MMLYHYLPQVSQSQIFAFDITSKAKRLASILESKYLTPRTKEDAKELASSLKASLELLEELLSE